MVVRLVVGSGLVVMASVFLYRRSRQKVARYFTDGDALGRAVLASLGLRRASDVDNLHVIFDFDHTLTSAESSMCHDHLGDVEEEVKRYLDFSNGGHPKLRGLPMQAWWDQVHDLLVSKRVSRASLNTALDRHPIYLRHGVDETLELLLELEVPVTVISAGLEHVISRVLPFKTCSLDDDCVMRQGDALHLVANRLVFDEDGKAMGAGPVPPVHAGNKDTVYERLRPFFDDVTRTRKKVLVVGDSVGDVQAAKYVPKTHLHTVGYFNPKNPWAKRDQFDSTYDSLLPHTASLIWLYDALKKLPE